HVIPDAGALTCSPPLSMGSTCTICTVPGGRSETTEGATSSGTNITCGDNKDNDCDGIIDCQDLNCVGKACDANGKQCTAGGLCDCISTPGPEASCGDGIDNDCDGKVDCKDTDCNSVGASCGPAGNSCSTTGGGTCVCSGNGGTVQSLETKCGDGQDNDCDGLTDCQDNIGSAHCQPIGNALGGTCSGTGNTCTTSLIVAATCSICSGNGVTPEQAS
ncbi:MAG: hypothetical protein AAB263_18575, partial [Planctomycetota bacterium]